MSDDPVQPDPRLQALAKRLRELAKPAIDGGDLSRDERNDVLAAADALASQEQRGE